MPADDLHNKMRVQYVLKERDARVACSIVETLRNVADIIDHSPTPVLEGIINYIKAIQKGREEGPPHRMVIRDAIMQYTAEALNRQLRMERQLYYGITGATNVAHEDDTPNAVR
ncbi:MAG: hypothetical protein J2P54_22565 [Bradyrhizobiaceae bacterium]|nr:hypothetical protein [Bradyrhizobiaceae bacterium]